MILVAFEQPEKRLNLTFVGDLRFVSDRDYSEQAASSSNNRSRLRAGISAASKA